MKVFFILQVDIKKSSSSSSFSGSNPEHHLNVIEIFRKASTLGDQWSVNFNRVSTRLSESHSFYLMEFYLANKRKKKS